MKREAPAKDVCSFKAPGKAFTRPTLLVPAFVIMMFGVAATLPPAP